LTLASAPPFGYILTDSVYYGDGSGVFTLTGVTTDTLAGLFSLAFPEATDAGATYGLGGAITATRSHPYAFDTNDTFSATLAITAADRAGNQATQPFTLFQDSISPTVTIAAPPVAPLHFRVSWLGQDGESGLRDYDVQYKVGITGTWTPWLTNTTQTQAPFVGERDQSYYFRVQATDNVNNPSAWVEAGPVTVSAVTKYYYHGAQRVAMRQGDVVYFIHADHLGSTSLTTDITGTVVAETRYLPYGEERWITGTLVTDFTFTGQRADSYIKLMEMGARWYDPQIGRWISPDSIIPNPANPQSLNHYTYGYNNPVRYYDSDGHCFPFCTAALAYGALRTLPRETLGFGSRQLAEAGIPIVSDFAAWDARTTDQLWQAANGVDLQGNALTTKEQVEIGVEGYANLVGEAVTIGAVAEGVGALWQLGKSVSRARGSTPGQASSGQGEFTIGDWNGYPEGIPRPQGPFRLLEGEEYEAARQAANKANAQLHRTDPSAAGKHIHEIHPVKFGGSPTDPANKVYLSPAEHAKFTSWWNDFLRSLKDE
jgi:RHS repeat-associated protein